MPYQTKTKGKTYPLLPCIDCGGPVDVPAKPVVALMKKDGFTDAEIQAAAGRLE